MNVGAHVSISKGLVGAAQEAAGLGATTFQIFSKNPRGRGKSKITPEDVAEAKEVMTEKGIESFYVHTPYYTNLASPKNQTWKISINSVLSDLQVADDIGSRNFVMHIGHHMGTGIEAGIERVISALQEIAKKDKSQTRILLEITAGQGTEVGNTFEELQSIIKKSKLPKDKLGIVLDTAHAFGAGYDLRDTKSVDQVLAKIDDLVGLEKLPLVHCNDSKGELGSNKDRHDHLGDGFIGKAGFKALVQAKRMADKDFIVETKSEKRQEDIELLQSFAAQKSKK